MTAIGIEWQPDGWGSRARIGLLTPHNDFVPEDEFHAMASAGVATHVGSRPSAYIDTRSLDSRASAMPASRAAVDHEIRRFSRLL